MPISEVFNNIPSKYGKKLTNNGYTCPQKKW
nr:MAG TPA: hypothetical protein [Caudoviricetes sp.]